MKKITAMVLALAMALSLAACGGSDSSSVPPDASGTGPSASAPAAGSSAPDSGAGDWSASERIAGIKAAGKIVLGTSADYPPFEFHTEIDGTDTIVGFDVALAQKVADALGVELEVVDMSFDNLLISLDKGDFDFVMASLSNTPERAKAVDFSSSYFRGAQVVLVRAEDADKYTTQESLAGCQVAAQKGAIQVPLANEIAGAENVVQLTKVGDMITELKAGKVEAVFLDNTIGAGYAAVHDDLVMQDIGIVYESNGNVAAVKKGDADLAAFISEVFDALTEEEINALLGEAQATAGIVEE
ncbi:transporter substrate-binding domain-containing protein [Anaerofilum sp. BX8]|uniref:Transporter substrate-binding domain-containing protein n=1 Tax=Anaerofilum hominis TaxID=2763016 RepID=A0A923I8W1_9FIRM|nr:transporter substrate-binding domain-containing protein [Anaerofilum hominis]MBC5581082.1 transporter substrate-binding domain-containing protein [Anaerofilum hominis]